METAHIYTWTSQRVPSFCENLESVQRLTPTSNRGKIDNLYVDLSEIILTTLKRNKYQTINELARAVMKKFNEAVEII